MWLLRWGLCLLLLFDGRVRSEDEAGLPLPCGMNVRRLNFSGLERTYHLYLPGSVCESRQDYAPLLLALHCLGCTAASEEQKYMGMAEAFGFVLLTPEGYGHHPSWNARYCCGDALEEGLDDVSFLEQAVHETTMLVNVSRDVYVTGFSNGGFMTSFLVTSGKGWVRAVAPTAGHVYQFLKASHPTPLFYHHGTDDQSVNFNGCCRANHCCCGIVSKTCVSVPDIFHEWLRINECSGYNQSLSVPGDRAVECYTGLGCQANTTYCAHHGVAHSAWSRHFPMAAEVALFFASDACSQHGLWDGTECTCLEGYSGRYCTRHRDGPPAPIKRKPPHQRPTVPRDTVRNSADTESDIQQQSTMDWMDVAMGTLGLLTIGLTVTVYLCGVGSGGGPRRVVRVPTEDEEMSAAVEGVTTSKRKEPR